MKKAILFSGLVLTAILALSCSVETNYTDEGHYGTVVVHNKSAQNITRIVIESDTGWPYPSTYHDEPVSIAQNQSSGEYQLTLEESFAFSGSWNRYRVYVVASGQSKNVSIKCYEDIVNNLYYDGTNLTEEN